MRDFLPSIHVSRIALSAARDLGVHICVRAEIVQKIRVECESLIAVARTFVRAGDF